MGGPEQHGADRLDGAIGPALGRPVGAQASGHLATILEWLPDALLIVDGDGRIVLANRQAERLLGYTRDELAGHEVECLVPERVRGAHRLHRAEYLAHPETVPMGTGPACRAAVRKDGREVPVEVSLAPLPTDRGLLVLCAVRDVTERTLAARATEMHLAVERIMSSILRASLTATSLDRLLALTLDELFSIPWLSLESKGAVFLLGSSPDTLVMAAQRGLSDSARSACARVACGTCLCGLAAQTQETVFASRLDERHATRYEGMHPHGHYCLPIMSSGRLYGVLALYLEEGHQWKPDEESFLRSVTDVLAGAIVRLHLTDELKRSEERFALAIKGTDAGIWDWDLRGNRIFFSPRWKSMLGFGEGELENDFQEWERRIHPDDRAGALWTLQEYLEGRLATYEVEHRLLHRDGTYRWILSRGAVVRDAQGRPYRMVGSHLDVTRSKRAEESVRTNTAKLIAAQRIQEQILPRSAPVLGGFDIAGRLHPAEFAAGDHFDYLPMDGGTLAVMIGDVSGHGFETALVMASVHAYLRLLALSHSDVVDVVRHANRLLAREIELGRYVTIILGRLDPAARTFTYVNAGHPAGFLLDRHGRRKASLDSTCIPVGIMEEAFVPAARTLALAPGDVLVCVTDGVTEAESPAGVPFGTDRLEETVRQRREQGAGEIIGAVWQAMESFCERTAFSDDATAIVIKAL